MRKERMTKGRKVHRSNSAFLESLEKLSQVKRRNVIHIKLIVKGSERDSPISNKKAQHRFLQHLNLTDETINTVKKFANTHNLKVGKINRAIGVMDVSGSAKALERAFSVELNNYKHNEFEHELMQVWGHTGSHLVPDNLHAVLRGVIGLSGIPMLRNTIDLHGPTASAATGVPSNWFADYYNFPANTTGRGQEIAIISCGGGFRKKDMIHYFKKVGIKPEKNIKWVAVQDSQINKPGVEKDAEIITDIQIASCAAPRVQVTIYATENSLWGFADAVQLICEKKNSPDIITYCWGASESNYTFSEIMACEQILKYAALVKRISIFCASGDKGSTNSRDSSVKKLDVQYPASSCWVTGCGGTMFVKNKNGRIKEEKVWKSPYLYLITNINASGGGFSNIINRPNYQVKELTNPTYNKKAKPKRGVPDVAGYADVEAGAMGYWIYFDNKDWISGGTSAVAPLWAALVARLNEGLGDRIGFLNPLIYKMVRTNVFTPIKKGNNTTHYDSENWSAGGIWNPCTGLGVPDGERMLRWLKKMKKKKPSLT